MAKPKILNEVPVSLVDMKHKLEEIRKRDTELNFRATKTEEYLNQITGLLSQAKAKELYKKLEELQIPRIKAEHIVKIIDILPQTEEHLKQLMQGYIITLSQPNVKKIIELVKEYIPAKK